MHEWIISSLITIGVIVLFVAALYLNKNHQYILVGIISGIIAILVLIGLIDMVHSLLYG